MDAMNVFQGIGVVIAMFALRFAIPALVLYGICRLYVGLCRKLGISEQEPPTSIAA